MEKIKLKLLISSVDTTCLLWSLYSISISHSWHHVHFLSCSAPISPHLESIYLSNLPCWLSICLYIVISGKLSVQYFCSRNVMNVRKFWELLHFWNEIKAFRFLFCPHENLRTDTLLKWEGSVYYKLNGMVLWKQFSVFLFSEMFLLLSA